MKLPRRQFLHLAAGAAALPAVSLVAWAQAYPTRPVRVIVPFAPAGTTDIAARLMGHWLSDRLGQQFVIENRPGASTTIGTEVVVRAPADGYTLLLAATASAINTTLFENKLNYNFLRDIVPIAGIFRVPNVMVVNPSVPAKTVPEFIAYAKANPGKINVESPGAGTSSHLAGELFKFEACVGRATPPKLKKRCKSSDLSGPARSFYNRCQVEKARVASGSKARASIWAAMRKIDLFVPLLTGDPTATAVDIIGDIVRTTAANEQSMTEDQGADQVIRQGVRTQESAEPEAAPEDPFAELPLPVTPLEAKRVWDEQRRPSSRSVAKALTQAGRPVHFTTVARWKQREWQVEARLEHPFGQR